MKVKRRFGKIINNSTGLPVHKVSISATAQILTSTIQIMDISNSLPYEVVNALTVNTSR